MSPQDWDPPDAEDCIEAMDEAAIQRAKRGDYELANAITAWAERMRRMEKDLNRLYEEKAGPSA